MGLENQEDNSYAVDPYTWIPNVTHTTMGQPILRELEEPKKKNVIHRWFSGWSYRGRHEGKPLV